MSILQNLIAKNKIADTHCHLHAEVYTELREQYIDRVVGSDVAEIWLVGTDQKSSLENIEIVADSRKKTGKLRCGIGFDMELLVPGSDLFSPKFFEMEKEELEAELARGYERIMDASTSRKVDVSLIGEIGLDHYWIKQEELSAAEVKTSMKMQEVLFRWQLEYAAKAGLPVSIHSRGAEAKCIKIVKEYKAQYPSLHGIFHSFTGSSAQMKAILGIEDFYVGLNGIITYKSATIMAGNVVGLLKKSLKETGGEFTPKALYDTGFVLETDSPYLVPGNAAHKKLKKTYGASSINDSTTVIDVFEFLKQRLAA